MNCEFSFRRIQKVLKLDVGAVEVAKKLQILLYHYPTYAVLCSSTNIFVREVLLKVYVLVVVNTVPLLSSW